MRPRLYDNFAPGPNPESKPPMDADKRRLAFLLASIAAWLWLWKFVGEHTWTWGRVTFWVLLAIVVLLCLVNSRFVGAPPRPATLLLAILLSVCAYVGVRQSQVIRAGFSPPWSERLWDVSQGAYDFNRALFDRGENPYRMRCQYHPVDNSLGYRRDVEGREYLFGWRYYHGYPHFPMSALWFAPFIGLTGGYSDIRVGNLVYYILNFALLNAVLLVGCERRLLACLVGSVAFLGVDFMVSETFQLGIVDQAFSAPLLGAGLLAMLGWWAGAGVLAGLALASKHFPAIPFALALSIYVYRAGALRTFVPAAGTTAAVVVLPFLLWDFEAFVSATVLHHVHEMRFGDNTALFFFLPDFWKAPFRLFGLVLIAAIYAWGFVAMRRPDARLMFLVAAVACVLINAFYPVTHLNHLESVLGVASISFAFGAVNGRR
jgi:hypothetical protein